MLYAKIWWYFLGVLSSITTLIFIHCFGVCHARSCKSSRSSHYLFILFNSSNIRSVMSTLGEIMEKPILSLTSLAFKYNRNIPPALLKVVMLFFKRSDIYSFVSFLLSRANIFPLIMKFWFWAINKRGWIANKNRIEKHFNLMYFILYWWINSWKGCTTFEQCTTLFNNVC